MKNYLLLGGVIFFSIGAWANQNYSAIDGQAIKIQASMNDLTRIKIKNGKVASVWGSAGDLDFKVEKAVGEVYLRPLNLGVSALSFFLKDSFNNTYTIVASLKKIPAQTVEIVPLTQSNRQLEKKYQSMPLVKRLKALFKAMALGQSDNFSLEKMDKKIAWWKEARLSQVATYLDQDLVGEVFLLENTTKGQMQMQEEEFLPLKGGVMAIAIAKSAIEAGEKTKIFVVRKTSAINQ